MSGLRTNINILLFWIASTLCGFSDFIIPAPYNLFCGPSNTTNAHHNTSYDNNTLYDLLNTPTARNMSIDSSELYTEEDYADTSQANTIYWPSLSEGGFCYSVVCSKYDPEYLVYILTAFLLLAMSFIYTRVCVKIYWMQHLLQGCSRRSFRRNKKGLITTMCIVGTFMVCWLPFCIFAVIVLVDIGLHNKLELHERSSKIYNYLYALLLMNCLCDPVIYALRMREVKLGYRRLLGRCFKKYKHHIMASDGCSSSYQMTTQFSSRVVNKRDQSTRSSTTGSQKGQPDQQQVRQTPHVKYNSRVEIDREDGFDIVPETYSLNIQTGKINNLLKETCKIDEIYL